MPPLFRPFLVALAAVLIAAGCATRTTVEKLYHDPAAAGAPYQRVLVVGVAGASSQRQAMEDLVASELEAAGIDAVPAYSRLGLSTVLLQEDIDDAASASNSDAILVTHIVSVETQAEQVEGRVDVMAECRGGNPAEYFLYDYREIREPPSVRFSHEIVVVSNLYDAQSGDRVWTIQSTCFDKAEFNAVLNQEARAIVRQLRRDRLLRSSGDAPAA